MNIQESIRGKRKSFMGLSEPCFWTNAIREWKSLLIEEEFKLIVIDSLRWLTKNNLVAVYSFVLMPNHVHIFWEQLKMNGKEYPKNSFEKFTSKQFKRRLSHKSICTQNQYRVSWPDREYNYWQKDPLSVKIKSRKMAIQKIDYMHNNPMQPLWNLTDDPVKYKYSSAKFYETGIDDFGLLTHFMDRF